MPSRAQVDIALLVPHYNELDELESSLKSVSFRGSLVIIVVDDGSVATHTPDQRWAERLETTTGWPVRLLFNTSNLGIEHALNKGLRYILEEIKPRYIARLDCRDFSVSTRFDIQYKLMEDRPELGLVGSWADVVEGTRKLYTIRVPERHKEIAQRMLINNCFIHPTVMFRTDAVERAGLYPTEYPAAEDYAYFFRFVRMGTTFNIQQSLVMISKTPSGISLSRRRAQLISRIRLIFLNFRFTPHALWGLLKASLLLLIPTSIVEKAKRIHDGLTYH